MTADQTPYAEGLARAVPAGGAAHAPAAAAGPAAPPAPTDAEGDRHELRQQLAVTDGENGADGELLARLGDVLDRVDPMPAGLVAAGRAVFTAADTDPAVPAYGRTDPRPVLVVRGTVPLTAIPAGGQGQRPDPSTGGGSPVPLPVEAHKPAGGATAPIPAAPPAHHLRLTPRQRFLQRLLDLIGRPA